jgi:hypothetical protein
MELTPYSLADNTLRIIFRGIQEPLLFGVTSQTVSQVRETLCFTMDEEGDYLGYAQFLLMNGGRVLLSADHSIVLHHVFDYGTPVGPPPPQRYGDIVPQDIAEEHEWVPPQAVIGVEGVGVTERYDQSRESLGTLIDSVQEGFPIGPFVEFMDDDGETMLVSSDHLAFALVDGELLGSL